MSVVKRSLKDRTGTYDRFRKTERNTESSGRNRKRQVPEKGSSVTIKGRRQKRGLEV